MARDLETVALIGFGEAGFAFAEHWAENGRGGARAYDIKTDDPATGEAKRADYERGRVEGCDSLAEALAGAALVISVVTADQAVAAARAAAAVIAPGTVYCDFNSVAPQTKQAAARLIEAAGALYADVAVMSPVRPARLGVPLLVSGEHGDEAAAALAGAGFAPRRVEGGIGNASTIKMLRSVMVKGIEALTAECFLAAHAAGVTEEVAATLGKSWPGVDWAKKADYNLERMIVHGTRRAAEMDEVAATVAAFGLDNAMAGATAAKQRSIGALGLSAPDGLAAKAGLILTHLLENGAKAA